MSNAVKNQPLKIVIVGAGPAGLMAAYTVAEALLKRENKYPAIHIHVVDQMPSVGRKFLRAGIGGLNLTHSEPIDQFLSRFSSEGSQEAIQARVAYWFKLFSPQDLRAFVAQLGFNTFVGTSGRVFPANKKAAPILRAFISRLRDWGVIFHMRTQWLGWDAAQNQGLLCRNDSGLHHIHYDAVVFALGGGSWAKLGSNAAWLRLFEAQQIPMMPLQAANCGFDVCGRSGQGWSTYFITHYAGSPFKSVAITWQNHKGEKTYLQGEFVATATGVEGSLVYHAAKALRQSLSLQPSVCFYLDLLPQKTLAQVQAALSTSRGKESLSTFLRKKVHLTGVKVAILYELLDKSTLHDMVALASHLKNLPIFLRQARPIDEAISTAGGVALDALTDDLMLKTKPGVFCAGEMLDWEAPTGGYLLSAAFATGKVAGLGVLRYLD